MDYTVYKVGWGWDRPPVGIGRGSLSRCRQIGLEYLKDLYEEDFSPRGLEDLDAWIEIKNEDGIVVETIPHSI